MRLSFKNPLMFKTSPFCRALIWPTALGFSFDPWLAVASLWSVPVTFQEFGGS